MELFADWLEWLPRLLDGLGLSLQVTILGLIVGIPLGLGLAILSSARLKIIRGLTVVAVEIGRGMPALVVLQMVYFGLPTIGITVSSFVATVVALALMTAAYTSEILRAGLRAVPEGEIEASNALGLTQGDILRFIVVPQGLRIAVPTLMGFSILIFQVSSLAFTIGLPELLSRGYSVGAATFQYLDVLVLAGLLYLVITIPAGWLVEAFEKRVSRHLK